MAFHTQGAPTVIPSNQMGAGAVQGDQLGDQLPGILASLQESPEATKTSNLYYLESVGQFTQPSYQRAIGFANLPVPVTQWGDSASVSVNSDLFWRGPMLLNCTFNIPYAYYGPLAYSKAGSHLKTSTSSTSNAYEDLSYDNSHAWTAQYAAAINVRPRMFYSWGAAYANLREIRMNLGGAMSYVLDHMSNFVALMASCPSIIQRAALMRAAGQGTLIPDKVGEQMLGLTHNSCEIGMLQCFTADGGSTSTTSSYNSAAAFGGSGTPQTGPTAVPAPIIEHWITAIKTPHTNFHSMQQYRRPIDTRLFSTDFIFDFFTAPSLDSFVDSGLGYQPLLGICPSANNEQVPSSLAGYLIPQAFNWKLWRTHDGLFPSMLYRQLYLPNYANLITSSASTASHMVGLVNADITSVAGGAGGSTAQDYRSCQYTSWLRIAQSAGYENAYGPSPALSGPTHYLNPSNGTTFPTPMYNTIISSSRMANPALGAKAILETRSDLCIYYPFQHFTSQVYRVNQITTSTGVNPYNPNGSYSSTTPYVNTTVGGQGYGLLSEANVRNFTASPFSYQNPLNVAISIPNNPLCCLYIMVMREKDRMSLGYSTVGQYSPALYWNALELQAMNLSYSSQILQRYGNLDEYFLAQLHERVEPLIVPFRGGCVRRSDLPLERPDLIQNAVGYPGAWYNSYIYELPMVDQLPIRNEAFFQQTPGFRGELLNFNFWINPTLKPSSPQDYDFRSIISFDNATTSFTPNTTIWYDYCERLAGWCPGIPQSACAENPGINWNLNNDNLLVVCVFAQNALWQLNPLGCKVIFARGA